MSNPLFLFFPLDFLGPLICRVFIFFFLSHQMDVRTKIEFMNEVPKARYKSIAQKNTYSFIIIVVPDLHKLFESVLPPGKLRFTFTLRPWSHLA